MDIHPPRPRHHSADDHHQRRGAPMDDDEVQPSTSAETIRHLVAPLHISLPTDTAHTSRPNTSSQPSSPRSSLPSPSSPSGESVSSLPSVSSSFLFSSGPGSPPHLGLHPELDSEPEQGDSSLIIPSLTLPAPLRRPTPYGQGLGEIRLLVLGRRAHGAESILETFADVECEDIVEVGQWEAQEGQSGSLAIRILKASTDWIEHRDAHGLEKHEPRRNIELIHLPEYSGDDNPADVLKDALAFIHSSFRMVLSIVHPDQPPNDLLATLLASPTTPLFTAMILALSHPLLPLEHTLISELSTHIPLIILPPLQEFLIPPPGAHVYARSRYPHNDTAVSRKTLRRLRLSSLQPSSALALRNLVFRQPEALATLRLEAVDRFLRWREVERAVTRLLKSPDIEPYHQESLSSSQRTVAQDIRKTSSEAESRHHRRTSSRWDKARWEAEWEDALSLDVAKTLRARRAADHRTPVAAYFTPATPLPRNAAHHQSPHNSASSTSTRPTAQRPHTPPAAALPPLDPLHIPSLVAFSLSLLTPLRERLAEVLGFRAAVRGRPDEKEAAVHDDHRSLESSIGGWALAGAFCTGVGVGIMLARM